MAFTEKPPILRGTEQEQLAAIRDYLFRVATYLGEPAVTDKSLFASIYPVGSVICRADSKSPASYTGGTWVKVQQSALPDLTFWKRTG